ncbi:MAG: hypothetical protein FWH14_07060 [Oscillospiraceae bacterium]|nr:hypothetical protein [Oscillospiraceae bacterium]
MNEIKKDPEINEEQLAKINKFTRRAFKKDEIYSFSVILCDNEVDRDNEAFTVDALSKLARLYIGKTGIFDHNHKGANQTARIYDAAMETDQNRITKTGEKYHYIKASAYMVRSEKNKDLILEIEGGIKKEVSVGCSMAKHLCSICGNNRKTAICKHNPGKTYNGKLCYVILDEPTDAYEWSFVAVPAQKGAGVVKKHQVPKETVTGKDVSMIESVNDIIKSMGKGDCMLDKSRIEAIAEEIKSLQAEAEMGRKYRSELQTEVLRLNFLAGEPFLQKTIKSISQKMDISELVSLKQSLSSIKKDSQGENMDFQLNPAEKSQNLSSQNEFKI